MKMKHITREDIKSGLMFLVSLVPSWIIKLRNKDTWIIAERPTIADDNGLYFYDWMRAYHPEKEVYFILSPEAFSFDQNDTHMIKWGTVRHYAYYMASNIHINTMFQSVRPSGRTSQYYESLFARKLKRVYLRHGIHKDGVEMHKYSVLQFRLFICGAKPEYDFFKANAGYPEKNLVYTGLARFDDLLKNKENKGYILLIPTWRRYIFEGNDDAETRKNKFLNSAFFSAYSSLLDNVELVRFLERNSIHLKFCLHAHFKEFSSLFSPQSKMISVTTNQDSIHRMLCETGLLVTDYSSVFFDAAYADKPMIYYHFDYEEFRNKHFTESYFSYERDGMGPVVYDEKALVDEIMKMWQNGAFQRQELYKNRAKVFFPLHDQNNCKRIYDEIVKLENE